jgi:hypothetical protein
VAAVLLPALPNALAGLVRAALAPRRQH